MAVTATNGLVTQAAYAGLPVAASCDRTSDAGARSSSPRFLELDALRGLAALAVVFCHYTSEMHRVGGLSWKFTWGAFGPHLFFIISGFVILMTLDRTRTWKDFAVSRCSRLYPAYWLSVLFTSGLLLVVPSGHEPPTVKQVLVNLSMLQAWLKTPDLNVVYWTLSVELRFYVVMLLLFMLGALRKTEAVCLAWLAAVVLFRTLAGEAPSGIAKACNFFLISEYAPLFIAGLLFYRWRMHGSAMVRHLLIAAAWAVQVAGSPVDNVVAISGFFALFHLVCARRLTLVTIKPLVFLGIISYSLYLIHEVIGAVMIPRLYGLELSPVVSIAIPLAISLGVASMMTFLVEQPAVRTTRNWYQRIGAGHRTGNSPARVAACPDRPINTAEPDLSGAASVHL